MHRLFPLGLAPRLAALAMGMTLPLVGLIVWMAMGGINRTITAAEWEMKGNAFHRPLDHLLEAIPRRLIAVQNHRSDIEEIDEEIDQALVDLDRIADRVGSDLQFTSEGLEARESSHLRISPVRDHWRALTSAAPDRAGYDRLVGDLHAMLSYAGDTSNQSIDPDLDSAYLIDVTLRALPQMQILLGDVLREAVASSSELISSNDKMTKRLAQLGRLRGEGLARIDRDLQIMLREDGRFYGNHVPLHVQLTEEWKHVVQTTDAFITLLEATDPVAPATLIQAGNAAGLSCRRFWTTSADQLDQLLTLRIRAQRAQRTHLVLAAGAMVLFCGLVGAWQGSLLERDYREKLRFWRQQGAGATSSTPSWSTRSN